MYRVRLLHCEFDGAYSGSVEDLEEVKDLEEDSRVVCRENPDVLAEAVVVLGYRSCERRSKAVGKATHSPRPGYMGHNTSPGAEVRQATCEDMINPREGHTRATTTKKSSH